VGVSPPEPIDMPFGLWSGVPDLITHAKFYVNRLRGFSAAASRRWPFPILFRTTLTTVLHYRADCEVLYAGLGTCLVPGILRYQLRVIVIMLHMQLAVAINLFVTGIFWRIVTRVLTNSAPVKQRVVISAGAVFSARR